MRNRTWLAIAAGLAVVAVVVQFQIAQSQERKSRATQKSGAGRGARRDEQQSHLPPSPW